jgi:hypothetical protein
MAALNGLGDYKVLLDAGYLLDAFRLDTSTLDGPDVLDGTISFVDVTAYVQGVSITRGRQQFRQAINAGRCSIRLDDTNGDFTIVNTASPYWDTDLDRLGFQPTRRVRIERDGERLFDGQIVTYDQKITLDNQSLITVIATDDLKQFDNLVIDPFTPVAQRSDERVVTVLTRPEVNVFTSAGQRVIESGDANLGTQSVEAGVKVGDYFDRIQTAEQGRIFITRDGKFAFQRRVPTRAVAGTPLEFSDTTGSGIPFRNFEVVYQ